MGGLLARLKTWWETADRTQRVVTVFGSAFLVLLLGGTFYFASRPHMAIVFSNLDSAEVGTVADEIQKMGIQCDYDVQGNVQVPTDKVAEVRAKLAEAGKLPAAGHMNSDGLDKINATTTTDVQKELILSAKQNEVEQAIEQIHGIDKANVQINLGDRSPFADDAKPATASVEVTLSPNSMIGPDQGRAIAMLVANSVTGLSPENVFVLDNTGHTLFDASHNGGEGGSGNDKISGQIAEKNRRQRELQEALDSTFGRGNTLVEVNLELDYDKTAETKEIQAPSDKPSEKQKQTESMIGDAGIAGGLSGAKSNITPTAPGPEGNKKYDNSQTTEVHPVNDTKTETEKAPGALKSMSIAALVNTTPIGPDGKAMKLSADDEKKLKQNVADFLAAYIAPWKSTNDANFTDSVTTVQFDATAQSLATQAEKADASRDRMQQAISLLPILALIFVGFLVAKAIGKAARPVMLAALPGGGTYALDETNLHSEHAALMEGLEGAHGESDPQEIALIQEKLNLPLEQIKRMSDEKSENVAMLIKSWIMEDHK